MKANPRAIWRMQWGFALLNLALTAPMIYLMLGLPLVMRQQGWSGVDIGVFQMAGLPALAKAWLAVPVQRLGRPRRWLAALCALYALALLGLALLDAHSPRPLLFALVLACALCATWADIPASALTMACLPPGERLRAGGARSASTFLAAIVGGGVMVLLQQQLGWGMPLIVLAVLLLLGTMALAGVNQSVGLTPAVRVSGWREFWQQPGAPGWALLLLGYFPFVATAWIYLKPLLLDHGFAAGQVAALVGIGGGALGAAASVLATARLRRTQLARALPWSAWANALALAALALSAVLSAPPVIWWLASALLAAAMGVSAALAFAVMMEFSRRQQLATDYGAQASLFAAGRLAVPPLAGLLLDWQGWPGMLLALTLAATLAACAAWRMNPLMQIGHAHQPRRLPPA